MPYSEQEISSNLVGFLPRLIAFFIDIFLLLICFLTVVFASGYRLAKVTAGDIQLINYLVFSISLLLIGPIFLSLAYFTILHSIGGRTAGKAIMGIRVVDCSGKSLGFGRSFLRWIGYQLSALPLFAGFLWSVLEKRHRAWHDILSASKVINDKISENI